MYFFNSYEISQYRRKILFLVSYIFWDNNKKQQMLFLWAKLPSTTLNYHLSSTLHSSCLKIFEKKNDRGLNLMQFTYFWRGRLNKCTKKVPCINFRLSEAYSKDSKKQLHSTWPTTGLQNLLLHSCI